ncbi:MAG: tetratricopeptide repeat protein [Gammaproteobacteria bacterium]
MLTCREKYKLGIHYELGIGVPQNYQQARELYLESYNCGIPAVGELLGEIYFEGKGVERDERSALAWFERCNSAPVHLAGASHCKIMMDLIEYKRANCPNLLGGRYSCLAQSSSIARPSKRPRSRI